MKDYINTLLQFALSEDCDERGKIKILLHIINCYEFGLKKVKLPHNKLYIKRIENEGLLTARGTTINYRPFHLNG